MVLYTYKGNTSVIYMSVGAYIPLLPALLSQSPPLHTIYTHLLPAHTMGRSRHKANKAV